MKQNLVVAALSAMLIFLAMPIGAQAGGKTDFAHLHPEPSADNRIPMGWVQFCGSYPADCRAPRSAQSVVKLDERSWRELVDVNLRFNKAIEPVTDEEQYGTAEKWTYATTGKGDCEDYVLEKRRDLINRGWPISALLIAVVLDKQQGGHAVLTVVTDRGEFILDNQTDQILPWSRSELTFIRRQSPQDQNVWQDLGRMLGRPDVVTATIRAGR